MPSEVSTGEHPRHRRHGDRIGGRIHRKDDQPAFAHTGITEVDPRRAKARERAARTERSVGVRAEPGIAPDETGTRAKDIGRARLRSRQSAVARGRLTADGADVECRGGQRRNTGEQRRCGGIRGEGCRLRAVVRRERTGEGGHVTDRDALWSVEEQVLWLRGRVDRGFRGMHVGAEHQVVGRLNRPAAAAGLSPEVW